MALTATIYQVHINLSDVDRGVYETLELRLARHPSESGRYLLTRTLAYCLSYEEGIAFSKGGLSDASEPPLTVRDPTGMMLAWIDVGAPSAERLHKAAKAAGRVILYTHAELARLQREAATRPIHRIDQIEVWRIDPALLDALEERLERTTRMEVVRSGGQLYVTVGGVTLEGALERCSLV
jgi:uncharacterized protein YaeQ